MAVVRGGGDQGKQTRDWRRDSGRGSVAGMSKETVTSSRDRDPSHRKKWGQKKVVFFAYVHLGGRNPRGNNTIHTTATEMMPETS